MAYVIGRDQLIYQMSAANQPALKVPAGSTVSFATHDCFEGQVISESQSMDNMDWDHINPATGPLYVEGAEPGDLLKIEIQSIAVADRGVMCAIPGSGLLGDRITQSEMKVVPLRDGRAQFNDQISLPVKPMIGVIGVAPAQGAIPCGTPGIHGGNMDNVRIGEGATLYLPVQVAGGLLAMGDLHACMGDGEIMVSGVEVAATVTVRVDLIRHCAISSPILEDGEYWYTIASDRDLLAAVKASTSMMVDLVMRAMDLPFNQAGMLLSASGHAQICQVVDPLLTARFALPKWLLKGKRLF